MLEISTERLAAATLKIGDLTTRFRVGRQTIYIWISDKGFPPPVKANERIARWIPAEIDAWAMGGRAVE